MANSVDITVKGQVITIVPQNVQCLVAYPDNTYAVVFEDGTSLSISKADYDAIKDLDYSQGGGGQGGGSNMMYDPSTGILSGAKTVDGEDYNFEVGKITISI